MEDKIPRMMKLREASKVTGVSYDCLRKGCLSGRFACIQSGHKFLINMDRLSEILNGTCDEGRAEDDNG